MHCKRKLAAALAAWLVMTASGWAAQLGDIAVTSALGSSFEATLPVTDVVDDGKNLSVRLAPTTAYIARGIAQDPQTLNFSLSLASRNPFVLRITSENSVSSPSFPLLLELWEGAKVTSRLYTVTLKSAPALVANPSVAKNTHVAPATAGNEAAAPTVPAPENSAAAAPSVETSPQVADSSLPAKDVRAPEGSVKPVVAPAVSTPSKPITKEDAVLPAPTDIVPVQADTSKATGKGEGKRPSVRVEPQPKPKTQAPDKKKDSGNGAKEGKKSVITETVQTSPGKTLWSTVTPYRTRFTGADTEQIIVAFLRRNPGCFPEGAVAFMRFGCTMVVPTEQEVRAVGKKEAHYYVQEQPQADARKRR